MYRQIPLPARDAFPDDPENFVEGAHVDGSIVSDDLSDIADYVVIGSGAAGASAALVLATRGYKVVVLEEGPWVRTRQFGVDVYPAMKEMFRGGGTSMALGRVMFPILQGACVGGSTTVNSAIAWRAPERVIENWRRRFGFGEALTFKELDHQFDEIERDLNVQQVQDQALGNNNSIFAEAAATLGIRAERIRRYDGGCEASASCLTGCRSGKKLGMNVTYIPETLGLGGRLYSMCRVEKVESRYGRAVAVTARFKSPTAPRLRVAARRGVFVAASAVQTPNLLRRSGVRSPALGKHFQAHPGTSLAALFDRDVSMHFGATQGFNSLHFMDSDHFKIETLSLPPELMAVRIPGVGPDLMHRLADYRHVMNWAVLVRAEAHGSVKSFLGKDQVYFTPTPTDMARLRKGLRTLSEMMFAAGAREIWPGVHGVPPLRSPDDVRHWDRASIDPRAYSLMASHLFGSARMGPASKGAVVGLDFQVHELRGLYVVDSSIFPTNLGINPQHTIMAVARVAAGRAADNPLPPAS